MPDDGVSNIPVPTGDETMADIGADVSELLLEQTARNHQGLMHDGRANSQNVHNILNNSATKKYNEEDPIQSASVEMVLAGAKKLSNS